jgi:hypothetical protein
VWRLRHSHRTHTSNSSCHDGMQTGRRNLLVLVAAADLERDVQRVVHVDHLVKDAARMKRNMSSTGRTLTQPGHQADDIILPERKTTTTTGAVAPAAATHSHRTIRRRHRHRNRPAERLTTGEVGVRNRQSWMGVNGSEMLVLVTGACSGRNSWTSPVSSLTNRMYLCSVRVGSEWKERRSKRTEDGEDPDHAQRVM